MQILRERGLFAGRVHNCKNSYPSIFWLLQDATHLKFHKQKYG